MAASSTRLSDVLSAFAAEFDEKLSRLVTSRDGAPAALEEAVRYAFLAPGKRMRPFLVHECCALGGGRRADAFPAAAAIEMVHAFSLVHDDLPAMDDDDLRRGRPTCHKVYGEAVAILAGDALLALAFQTLADEVPDKATSAVLVSELARGTGWCGMIGGQAADLQGETKPPDLGFVRYIHERKTGALFSTACRMGGIVAGADSDIVDRLGAFGLHLGLAFQIADDLLDLTSTADELGKGTQKDGQSGKQTYPACVGMDESQVAASAFIDAATAALANFGEEADNLKALANFAINRRA